MQNSAELRLKDHSEFQKIRELGLGPIYNKKMYFIYEIIAFLIRCTYIYGNVVQFHCRCLSQAASSRIRRRQLRGAPSHGHRRDARLRRGHQRDQLRDGRDNVDAPARLDPYARDSSGATRLPCKW
jgi:hypothetical protein